MQYCICENNKTLKKQLITRKYVVGGLDNVTLIGVEYYRCDVCGEEFFGYGNIEQLNQVIANALLKKKGLLSGSEVRFLRKHLGYSGAMFAELIGYEKETVYRIEKGKQSFAPSFDRLVRYFVASKLPDRDYDLHELILKKQFHDVHRLQLKHMRSGKWEVKKAA